MNDKEKTSNSEIITDVICDCGHGRREHHFICRGWTPARVAAGRPSPCACTHFSSPETTSMALHPGPTCPCVPCFLGQSEKAA